MKRCTWLILSVSPTSSVSISDICRVWNSSRVSNSSVFLLSPLNRIFCFVASSRICRVSSPRYMPLINFSYTCFPGFFEFLSTAWSNFVLTKSRDPVLPSAPHSVLITTCFFSSWVRFVHFYIRNVFHITGVRPCSNYDSQGTVRPFIGTGQQTTGRIV